MLLRPPNLARLHPTRFVTVVRIVLQPHYALPEQRYRDANT